MGKIIHFRNSNFSILVPKEIDCFFGWFIWQAGFLAVEECHFLVYALMCVGGEERGSASDHIVVKFKNHSVVGLIASEV